MSSKHPGRPKRTEPWPQCKAEGCTETIEGGSKGFCHRHYIYVRRGIFDAKTGKQLREFERVASYGPGVICSVESCGRKARAGGLCHAHWQRQSNGTPLESPIQERSLGPFIKCLLEDCQERASSLGMCPRHADQRRKGRIDKDGNWLRDKLRPGKPRAEKWTTSDGYVFVPAPLGHPYARADGSILEHRLVMEQHLGVYLNPDEFLVHHKFGNRSDNTPDKLEVLSAHAQRGEGHPPGSEIPPQIAIQVLLQQTDLPDALRQWLELYKVNLVN